MRSIDDYDYELANKKERYNFKFTINFKKIYVMNNTLIEDNGDRDDKYPKNILLTMLAGIWVALAVLFCFSKSFLLIVTLPFMFFYGMAFFSTFKAWREYKYKKSQFFLINIAALIVAAAIGVLVQIFVLNI